MSQSITPDHVAELQKAADDAAKQLADARAAEAREAQAKHAAVTASRRDWAREHIAGRTHERERSRRVDAAFQAIIDAAVECDGSAVVTRWLEYVAVCAAASEQSAIAEGILWDTDDRVEKVAYSPKQLSALFEQGHLSHAISKDVRQRTAVDLTTAMDAQ